MSESKSLRDYIPKGEGLFVLVAVVIMVLIIAGYLLFIQQTILPQLTAREELVTKLAATQKQVREAESTQRERPDKLKDQVAAAQTSLNDAAKVFLNEAQAAEVLARLYTYAGESGVEITELQTQPTPPAQGAAPPTAAPAQPQPTAKPQTTATPTPAAKAKTSPTLAPKSQPSPQPTAGRSIKPPYDVKTYRLQVLGAMPNLIGFVSRIKEASLKSVLISNVNITSTKELHTLITDIALYTSSYSTGVAGFQRNAPTPTAGALPTLMPRTPFPTPTFTPLSYLVRPPNWPTDRPWPPVSQPGPTVGYTATSLPPTAMPGPSPVPTATPEYILYVVRRGDTLYGLARRYGTSVEAIMAANGLTDYALRVGQQLRIPLH